MLRKFFVGCVIVFAMCLVVWGAAPALMVANDSPLVEEKDLPPGVVTSQTGGNKCCLFHGQEEPCGTKNHANWKLCIQRGVDCSYTRNTYWLGLWQVTITCSCKDWVKIALGMPGYYIIEGCGCG